MDRKKNAGKKGVIKRQSDEGMEPDKKKQRTKAEEAKCEETKVAAQTQVVEVVEQQGQQQVAHAGQVLEGNFEQPVFVNMKGEPVQLGPNTVIVYEQGGNPSNLSFGGMWTMDSAGRIVMAETIYDVKGEPEEEGGFVQNTQEVQAVEESAPTYQQYELSGGTTTAVDGTQEYEVAIIDTPQDGDEERSDEVTVSSEEQLAGLGAHAVRWLNQKYDFVVRKLQLNYDAGVKLQHSPTGCIQCVYFTTPGMQLAFNAVPQFLCIETGIEFTSAIPSVGGNTAGNLKHTVTLFLAEDGNGKSVIVSAGISTLVDELSWLLETFKSCNPAWRQVRCVVADPTKCQQVLRAAFPAAHVTCSVWQASRAAARLVEAAARREGLALCSDDLAAKSKAFSLATLRGEHSPAQLQVMRRGIVGASQSTHRLWESLTRDRTGAINKLEAWLEAENYTNILHKGLERLIGKFSALVRGPMQPDEFVSCFFNVANQLEEERRNFALSRLRDTENLKQSPTDTITQYAYNLMSHQTSLAQKCLDDRAGRRHSSAAICKYGTSTQECSCMFSKVFRLPCRHILMLTTELKVKTHIPFEPRWTVQHCLFGCDDNSNDTANAQGGAYMEQVVVEEQPRQALAPPQQQIHQVGGVRQQQYVLATPGQQSQPVSQVIFCNSGVGGVSGAPVITSVMPAGGAVLTPHHTLHHA